MGTEILDFSDRLLAAVLNGIYQGLLITALVALGFRGFSRINAATRHAVWLCTLVLLVLLVVAHGFFQLRPDVLQSRKIARTAAMPVHEQETGAPDIAAVAATPDDVAIETVSSGPKWLRYPPAEQEPLANQEPDALSLTSAGLPEEAQPFSVADLPAPRAPREGDPDIRSIADEPLAGSNAYEPSAWWYTTMQRLVDPVSLTVALESRAARIGGAILLSVCLMLSAGRLLLLLFRLRQIRKLKRQSFPAYEALEELFRSLVTRHCAGRKVDLKTMPGTQSSFVLGFLNPVILLPAETMEPTEAEQILRHELAHVRRRDDWANLLQHCIVAAFPFHPAVLWISRRLSLEREIACDDDVLQSSAQPHAYALLLANLAARMQHNPPLLAPGASNNKTQLQQRIDMILNPRRNTSPRLVATWLTLMASAAALFSVTAICLAPRIVLAQSAAAPVAANASLADEAVQATPAVALVAVSFSPEPAATVSSPAALPVTAELPALGSGPKMKPGVSTPVPGSGVFNIPRVVVGQPAALPLPAYPASVAPAPLIAQSLPLMPPEPPLLSAAPAPAPRPMRTPRPGRAESADSTLEERLERLEKMVESLMGRGYATHNPYATQNPFNLKPSPDQVGAVDRKEIAKIESYARRQAEMGRKHAMDEKEMERIKEHAEHDAARAADRVKRAAEDAERIARTDQKRQTKRIFKEDSHKQLDELHKRLEMLEREREKLEHQIEELERHQEQLDEQQNENHNNDAQPDNDAQSDPSPEANSP